MKDKFAKLHDEINRILHEMPAPKFNAHMREISLIQEQLREDLMYMQFSLSISEISTQLSEVVFSPQYKFKGEHYILHWNSFNSGWCFWLENTKSDHKKKLMECPEAMLEKICPHLDTFTRKLYKENQTSQD